MEERTFPKTIKHNIPTNFASLGTEIKISPKSCVSINKAGYKIEYFNKTDVDVINKIK